MRLQEKEEEERDANRTQWKNEHKQKQQLQERIARTSPRLTAKDERRKMRRKVCNMTYYLNIAALKS